MPKDEVTAPIHLMDKNIQVKCASHEVSRLQRAANYVDQKMREVSNGQEQFNLERVAMIAALNIANELLDEERHVSPNSDKINERIRSLEEQVKQSLIDVADEAPTSFQLEPLEFEYDGSN